VRVAVPNQALPAGVVSNQIGCAANVSRMVCSAQSHMEITDLGPRIALATPGSSQSTSRESSMALEVGPPRWVTNSTLPVHQPYYTASASYVRNITTPIVREKQDNAAPATHPLRSETELQQDGTSGNKSKRILTLLGPRSTKQPQAGSISLNRVSNYVASLCQHPF
jgi:hypothetical protein